MIVRNESHLRRLLAAYQTYYNVSCTHLGIAKESPDHRPILRHGTINAESLPRRVTPSLRTDTVFESDKEPYAGKPLAPSNGSPSTAIPNKPCPPGTGAMRVRRCFCRRPSTSGATVSGEVASVLQAL